MTMMTRGRAPSERDATTTAKRRAALSLASAGVSVSLSHNYLYLTKRAEDATSPIGCEILGPDAPGPSPSDRYTFASRAGCRRHQ